MPLTTNFLVSGGAAPAGGKGEPLPPSPAPRLQEGEAEPWDSKNIPYSLSQVKVKTILQPGKYQNRLLMG